MLPESEVTMVWCDVKPLCIFIQHSFNESCYWAASEWGNAGLILGLRPANERRRYKVTPSLIGWAQS